jgi:hypothetical protein
LSLSYIRDPDGDVSYVQNVASSIAAAQITNGGPVILYQPENEYTGFCCGEEDDGQYMQDVIDQARQAGVVVSLDTSLLLQSSYKIANLLRRPHFQEVSLPSYSQLIGSRFL